MFSCSNWIKSTQQRPRWLRVFSAEVKILTNIVNKTVSIGDKWCMKCRRHIWFPLRKKSNIDEVESPIEEEAGHYFGEGVFEFLWQWVINLRYRNGSDVCCKYTRNYTRKIFPFVDWITPMRNAECRNTFQALVVLLFKLRSGSSNSTPTAHSYIGAYIGSYKMSYIGTYIGSSIGSYLSVSF